MNVVKTILFFKKITLRFFFLATFQFNIKLIVQFVIIVFQIEILGTFGNKG